MKVPVITLVLIVYHYWLLVPISMVMLEYYKCLLMFVLYIRSMETRLLVRIILTMKGDLTNTVLSKASTPVRLGP